MTIAYFDMLLYSDRDRYVSMQVHVASFYYKTVIFIQSTGYSRLELRLAYFQRCFYSTNDA